MDVVALQCTLKFKMPLCVHFGFIEFSNNRPIQRPGWSLYSTLFVIDNKYPIWYMYLLPNIVNSHLMPTKIELYLGPVWGPLLLHKHKHTTWQAAYIKLICQYLQFSKYKQFPPDDDIFCPIMTSHKNAAIFVYIVPRWSAGTIKLVPSYPCAFCQLLFHWIGSLYPFLIFSIKVSIDEHTKYLKVLGIPDILNTIHFS